MRNCASVFAALLLVYSSLVHAEPYLAVQKGLKCATCHVAPSGGGLRTPYGNVYQQKEMAANSLDLGKLWTGAFGKYLAVGGDVRASWQNLDVPGQSASSESGLDELLTYVELKPIPDYLSLYVDARLRPDDPVVREQYIRVRLPGGKWSLRAGDFFLPFGFRLQDDDAFIRQVSGINFNTPDAGWQVGYEGGAWSGQLAVTRGTAGGPETDSGKQYSFRVVHVKSQWRVGTSFNFNDARVGNRQMQNIFAGIRTGKVAWLGEIGQIIDDGTPTGRRKSWTSLVEANYGYRQGHNLKATFEWYDPDNAVSNDEQNRFSLVWEYSPIQFLQGRVGYRRNRGIPQNPGQNREQLFLELHGHF